MTQHHPVRVVEVAPQAQTRLARLTGVTTGICLDFTTTTLTMLVAMQRARKREATSRQVQTTMEPVLGILMIRELEIRTGIYLESIPNTLAIPTGRRSRRLRTASGIVPTTATPKPSTLDGTYRASITTGTTFREHRDRKTLMQVAVVQEQAQTARRITVCFTTKGPSVEAATRLIHLTRTRRSILTRTRSTVARISLMVSSTTARKSLCARPTLSILTAQA